MRELKIYAEVGAVTESCRGDGIGFGLSRGERLDLVDQLIETVGSSEEWMMEVEGRAADPAARFYSWEEVQAEANANLRGVSNVADPAP